MFIAFIRTSNFANLPICSTKNKLLFLTLKMLTFHFYLNMQSLELKIPKICSKLFD